MFKLTPSALTAGPLAGQRLTFTSSVEGQSIPDHRAVLLGIDRVIKADGSIEGVQEDLDFSVAVLSNGFSYDLLNFTSELENPDTEDSISLESGDLVVATVEHSFPEDEAPLRQVVAIPIVESGVEAISAAILEDPNVPLANNAEGQLEASNVTIQTTGTGSAHTPNDVVVALLQRLLASQELPDGSVGRALQDANKFGPSRVIDTTDSANPIERTFDEQPI